MWGFTTISFYYNEKIFVKIYTHSRWKIMFTVRLFVCLKFEIIFIFRELLYLVILAE